MEVNKRQIQKEATRRRILQAAYDVYSEEGFGAATNSIARAANIAHGSIFVHFPTVEDLKISLLEQFGSDFNKELHNMSENCASLKEFLDTHILIIMKHQRFYQRLIAESSYLPGQVKYIYVSIQSTVSFHMSKILEKSQAEGKIKILPLYFIFNTWLGLLHYYIANQELFGPEGTVFTEHKEELVRNFMDLLSV